MPLFFDASLDTGGDQWWWRFWWMEGKRVLVSLSAVAQYLALL